MQSLRSELVYGEVDYVEAFSNGRQLPGLSLSNNGAIALTISSENSA